ncbi:MAG: S9 family peptidase [Verrucomicrobiales bacterium]|nr:S9 family peptidase [Verrucomicrobiales bacterium]
MRIPRLLGYILAWTAGWAVAMGADSGLVSEGIPTASDALRANVARYLEFRAAAFQDWHPRRRDVLITTRFGETAQLHLVQQPEGARRQLTFLKEPVSGGTFRPTQDGQPIVFLQDIGGGEFYQFFKLSTEDGRVSLITDGKSRNTEPCWSSSGALLAYSSTRRNGRDTDLYVMDPAQPASDRRIAELSGGGWTAEDWTKDDRQLLAVSYVSITESSLHLIDVATGVKREITPATGEKASYAGGRFAADGRSVITVSDRGGEFKRLWRIDLASGRMDTVGPAPAWDVEAFDLSPDGQQVAYFANEDGISRLHVLELATEKEKRLPKLPAGVAAGLKWHANGRDLGFTLSSARSPNDVYSVDVRKQTVTRWTASETGGLNASRFAEPEWVRVKSFDGQEVSGFIYRPDPKRFPGPRPVLISIHGGPESQARPGFQARWNYLTEELGVALLYTNVRGSAGYGKTFLTLDNGMKREDSVRDIGAFLDWIGTQPGLDAQRVGVYGGSYGGYMVLASLVHHGARLRCAVDVVGISNFLTFLKNTQDYRRDLRRVEYGDEREPAMAEFLSRISPLTQVDRIRKPLLVVQGKNDPRVPLTEAEQMVRAMRDQGGTVWYLMAPDEGHGFQKKKNIDAMFLGIVQFLETHLLN